MKVRFTKSARRHRIGKHRVLFIIENYEPRYLEDEIEVRAYWVAPDNQGLELEVVAVVAGEEIVVFHAMPARFRRGSKKWPR